MTRAVVILGAGASADFGVPTLANIFKDRYAREYLKDRPDFFSRLNEIFWEPRGYELLSSEQSLSIEQMLTLLRDWEQEEHLPREMNPKLVSNELSSRLVRPYGPGLHQTDFLLIVHDMESLALQG